MTCTVVSPLRNSATLALWAAVISGCAGSDPGQQAEQQASDTVWVLHGAGGSITRLDPATGAATAVAMVGRGAVGLIAR